MIKLVEEVGNFGLLNLSVRPFDKPSPYLLSEPAKEKENGGFFITSSLCSEGRNGGVGGLSIPVLGLLRGKTSDRGGEASTVTL